MSLDDGTRSPGVSSAASSDAAATDVFELSAMQRSIWFDEQLRPASIRSHLTTAVRLVTDADPDLLRQSFARVLRDHDSLRATFHDHDGTPRQRVHAEPDLDDRYLDAREWSDEEFTSALSDEHERPFDLSVRPPVRLSVFRRDSNEYVTVIGIHHIIADLWSEALLGHAIAAAFAAATTDDADPADVGRTRRASRAWTYRDFVEHEQSLTASDASPAAVDFWRELFETWVPQSVPADRAEPDLSTGRGDAVAVRLDPELVESMRAFADTHDTSLRSLVLLAFQVALARTTGSSDVVVAESKANRSLRLVDVIGCCINHVPRRLRVEPDITAAQAATSLEDQSRASRPHEAMPFDHLLRELRPGHGTEPFFEAAFAWQKTTRVVDAGLVANLALGRDGARTEIAGVSVQPVPMPTRSAPFPLTLLAATADDDVYLTVEFQQERFDRSTVEVFTERVEAILRGIVEAPDGALVDIDASTQEERQRRADAWERVRHPVDESTAVHHLIERHARHDPAATAVRFGAASLTYAALDRRANRLARHLVDVGVASGDLVGICQDRSIDMVVSILAAWKAGAGYVPMDPGFPVERLGVMLADAEIERVVTRDDIWAGLAEAAAATSSSGAFASATAIDLDRVDLESDAEHDVVGVEVPVDGTDLAYVTFTSGSTGRPKGVMVEHRNVVNFANAMARRPGLASHDRVLATTTLSFDISVLELIVPLVVGATIELVDRDTARDPLLLAAALDGVTVAQGTPTMWKMLIDFGWRGNPDLVLLCGGEPLPLSLARDLADRCHTLWNMYGPTETTVWSSVGSVDRPVDHVSIGTPVDNTRLVVLDPDRRRCPDGTAGELWIGGAGVTRGYVNRPDLTAERFVVDPLGEGHRTLYRTGDLVRHTAENGIEFLGRLDEQVKVRGHRIELGEIEAAIERHPLVLQCVAAVREYGDHDQRIVAYYRLDPELTEGLGVDADERRRVDLRRHARTSLPDYMVPAAFVFVNEFPRTPNDKIDRDRLPMPDGATRQTPAVADHPPASSDRVAGVLDAYRAVFGDDGIGESDDFFELGGHSLLATRLASRLRGRFGREVTLRSVFEHPTPSQLASVIDSAPNARPSLSPDRLAPPPGSLHSDTTTGAGPRRDFALSSSQERMWFLQQLNPAGTAYNLSGVVRIRGPFDLELLRRAFDRVVERHTSLRSTFVLRDGRPVVDVGDPFAVDIEVVDHRNEGDRGATLQAARREIESAAGVPFDLTVAPLFRVVAHRIADDELLLGLTFHHIIADQWAFGVLADELSTSMQADLRGEAPRFDPAPRAELYSEWQRSEMRPATVERLLGYWRHQLDGLEPVEIPPDLPRPATMSGRGATITMPLTDDLIEAVRATALEHRVSEFMVQFAAFQLHLHRETGAEDIGVGVPIANRHWLESESLITTLVNTLVLRNAVSDAADFGALLADVRDTTLDAYAHQDLPFERLIEALAPRRDPSRSPVFQILFNAQNAPFEIPAVDGVQIEVLAPERRAAQFDLSVTVDTDLTSTTTLEYATDLYDDAHMRRFLEGYLDVLRAVSSGTGASTPVAPRHPVPVATPTSAAVATHGHRREAPRAGLEQRVAARWSEALGVATISRHDDFFELGGHSILAVQIFADLAELFETSDDRPPLSLLFSAPTVASFSAALETGGWSTPWTSLVQVSPGRPENTGNDPTPFFYVSPFLITALSFHELAERVDTPRPFYAFQPQGLENDEPVHQRVEDMAEHYIAEMKTVQPVGPYLIGGHCAGGWVAFEMARQLEAQGDEVSELLIVDVEPPGIEPPRVRWPSFLMSRVKLYGSGTRLLYALRWQYAIWRSRKKAQRAIASTAPSENFVREIHRQAHERYEGGAYTGDITLIRSQEWELLSDKRWHDDWRLLTTGAFRSETVPGAHSRLLDGAGVRDLAAVLRTSLARHD